MLLAALASHVRRRHRISIHKTQLCQNVTLFSIYDLIFYLKLSIPSFGRNFNQAILGKINQVRVFLTLIPGVAVMFQGQRKSKDCDTQHQNMGNCLWSWPNLSAPTSTRASWIPLVTDWHASPTDLCRAMHSLDGPWSATLSTSAMLLHPSSQWEASPHPGASFSSFSGSVSRYVGNV